jgi:SET domain-containing protein
MSMLLVRTYLAPSPLHGIGIFASDDIPQGTLMWRLDPKVDTLFTDHELENLSAATRECLDEYIYQLPGFPFWILDGDHARHFNHSRTPTMRKHDTPFESYALRDIKKGEELTCDYRLYMDEEQSSWL